ncbi:hypothetical protein [Pontibacter russatus]|uniref:hypothetical protein n=1 Tax=Pontibacter russatus TaxID=2694929 RepID=UPI00137B55F2|nr:hypothetical protein [Pontibacter russatus]
MNNNIGALSALKGYRLQFLYSLFRILNHNSNEAKFAPEGKFEDLDIYDLENNLIEIIQIKALSEKLTLSNVLSSKGTSFLKRALEAHALGNSPKIHLVSFGVVNEDIKELSKSTFSQGFVTKLKRLKLSDTEINILRENFIFQVVGEDLLLQNIIDSIEKLEIFSDIKTTLELLIYWIYNSAEKQLEINCSVLKDHLLKISKFLSERLNFSEFYGSLIRPLLPDLEAEDVSLLRSDFYKGVSATYKHIIANVDVLRKDKLRLLHSKFEESNIVFVHGASGQGKSTLAYRYLRVFANNSTVFELFPPADSITLYKLVDALEGISKGIGFPLTIYLDVKPGNNLWISVIEELASKKNFNFLVTLREEDWNTINVGDKFQFSEIELKLEIEEAKLIYNSLSNFNSDLRFVDFEDAWYSFGGKGPLLEFVYLITQGESITKKLKSQIEIIREKSYDSLIEKQKIKLLRYVTLADAYGASIKLKEISSLLQDDEISYIINLLQKEYLVKVSIDNTTITGLHPVRSMIIVSLLFNDELHTSSEYAIRAVPVIEDSTIFNFLRNAFKKALVDPNLLVKKLTTFTPKSWQAYFQIFQSLLWKGIDDYISKNELLLNEIYSNYGSAWIVVANFDFVNAMNGESLMENSIFFTEEQRQYAKSINQKFTEKGEVLAYCKKWINTVHKIEPTPNIEVEWQSFGYFLFWLDYLNIKNIKFNIEVPKLQLAFMNFPIPVLASLLYSLKRFSIDTKNYANEVEQIFLARLYSQFNIVSLDEADNRVSVEYIFDILDEKTDTEESDLLHAKSIQIIDILRLAFPENEYFCTKGYGQSSSFLPDQHDSSVKKISKSSVPLKPLVKINSTYINLFNFQKRPNSWKLYVEEIINQRKTYIKILEKLKNSLVSFHNQKNYQTLVKFIQDFEVHHEVEIKKNTSPSMPKVVIDEFGDYGDGGSKYTKSSLASVQGNGEELKRNSDNRQTLAVRKYDDFIKLHTEFSRSTENFIIQSRTVLYRSLKEELKEDVNDIPDYARVSLVGNLFKSFEILEKYQVSFRKHFSKFVDKSLVHQLERNEHQLISALCFLWKQYIYTSNFLKGNVEKIALNHIAEIHISFKKRFSSEFKKLGRSTNASFTVEFSENSNRCIIIADTNTPIESLSILKEVYDTVYAVINKPEYASLKRLLIDTYYPSFYVVPLIKGKSLSTKWHEFKSYNLAEKTFEELKQFNLLPHDIDDEVIEKYQVRSWSKNIDSLNELSEMTECISFVYQLVYHLVQLKVIEEKELNQLGHEVLRNHVKKISLVANKKLQIAINLYGTYAGKCSEGEFLFENDNEKTELIGLMLSSFKNFFPYDEMNANNVKQFSLDFESLEDWIPRLESLVQSASVIYLFLAGKVIEKHLNLE